MAKKKVMSPDEVAALVGAEKSDALSGEFSTELEQERERALNYYRGDMKDDMPTLPDRSTAVSTDVRDTIEGLMPILMDIFTAGHRLTRFKPTGPEDEAAAKQEGDYVNHVIMEENSGWMTLYSFIKDALLSKVGVVKVWWGEEVNETREKYEGLDDTALGMLLSDPSLELVSDMERVDPYSMQTPELSGAVAEGGGEPQPPPSMLHDVVVARKEGYGCVKIEPVPPEEFGISRYAKSIKDATYLFHETKDKTRADLIEAGFDKAQVMALPVDDGEGDSEAQARDTVNETDGSSYGGNTMNRMAEKPTVTEHYVRMDYENDGTSRLYRVITGGDGQNGTVLKMDGEPAIEEVDSAPFAAQTPVPMPHRFFGLSIADLVLDIQRIKTSLTRSLLDNIYTMNNNRMEVAEEGVTRNTLDDILDNRVGGVIRTKRAGSVVPLQVQSVGDVVLPAIQYQDSVREWRTGVTRQGQGIEANTLQNQTAEAVGKVFTAAQARTRLIARIFAETGIRDLVSLVHETIRKNDDKINTFRLRNEWVSVDPRVWKNRKDMTIEVGLGSGSRDQQLQFLFALLNLQKEALANPGTNLVTPDNIYNTLEKIVDLGGLPGIEPYFMDPQGKQYQPPPDPKQIEMQQKAQEAQQKAQIDQFKAQQDAQLARDKAKAEAELAFNKMMLEARLKWAQMQMERGLKVTEMNLEAGLQRESNLMRAATERENVELKAQNERAKVNVGNVQMGGKVG